MRPRKSGSGRPRATAARLALNFLTWFKARRIELLGVVLGETGNGVPRKPDHDGVPVKLKLGHGRSCRTFISGG